MAYNEPIAIYVIIAPFWKGAPWFSRLLYMSERAFILPTENLFVQVLDIPQNKKYISNPKWEFIMLTRGLIMLQRP